jgi:uncharacterized protein YlzI (FlbEa/FlbD family)
MKPFNITFKITDAKETKPMTFYHIDAITSKGDDRTIIVSGGKEWVAVASYEEVWEKLKKLQDESAS